MSDQVTMADVAKRAGVHATTVSMALRNHPSLPVDTRLRLQGMAREMGYSRDPALSALVAYRNRRRTKDRGTTLAYLTNSVTRWGWQDLPAHDRFFRGALQKASDLGYRLEHFWLGEPGLTHRRMSDILFSRGISGLIVASQFFGNEGSLDFAWPHFSAVKIDYLPRAQPLNMVTNDQRSIIGLAFERARAAGYRRIGFVIPFWWDEFCDLAWSAGFLAHQQQVEPADRVPILRFAPPSGRAADPSGRSTGMAPPRELDRWLNDHRPDIVLSHGRFVAPSFTQLGVSVLRDVAFADIYLDETDGRTAGVYQNCLKVGAVAVDLLAAQLQQHEFGVPQIPTTTIVEGSWFNGDTMPSRQPSASPGDRRSPDVDAIRALALTPATKLPGRAPKRARDAALAHLGE